jgi:mycofactocin precursor
MAEHMTVLSSAAEPEADQADTEPLAADELLVEDVSIDGLCGVY